MKKDIYVFLLCLVIGIGAISCKNQDTTEAGDASEENQNTESAELLPLKISENQRYFMTSDGKPFFWLGDTGWLAFNKLNREEIEKYVVDRKEKQFNVLQVMVLHTLEAANVYNDSALVAKNVAKPVLTEGNSPTDSLEYDFWDHVDYAVKTAEDHGMYMAMVPVWGGNIKDVTEEEAREYAQFLAERYKDNDNVIWLNGGDTFGNEYNNVWNALGETLHQYDPDKLITFHPRGRHDSSDWFHDEEWLDFNMFQSGHRRYDQDDTERNYGEDNWRFVKTDYNLKPVKPTLDGEPSYEGIPQGLHDTLQPFWNDNDVRRYAYWSVFEGAAGYTYGHSGVMQMHRPQDKTGAYGNKKYWEDATNDPGAKQMQYLKQLMLDYSYFDRKPDSSLIINQGERYDYLPATTGDGYAMIYTYTGREIQIDSEKLDFEDFEAKWYDPKDGKTSVIKENGITKNGNLLTFKPASDVAEGNDWVLILEQKKS